jgi:hypothetical protein
MMAHALPDKSSIGALLAEFHPDVIFVVALQTPHQAALEGERKHLTVLFAELDMELLADRDPEEARKLLDPVFEWLMDAVHHLRQVG